MVLVSANYNNSAVATNLFAFCYQFEIVHAQVVTRECNHSVFIKRKHWLNLTWQSLCFRATQDFAGSVQDKDPTVHRPAEPKVSGRSAHCQGHEGLPKTQVWQCLTEADKLVSVGSLKTLCKLFFHFYSKPLGAGAAFCTSGVKKPLYGVTTVDRGAL